MLRGRVCPERLQRGWSLLTVETEVNGDSRSTNKRSPRLVRWARRAGTIYFCSALAALDDPV
jgi:hypothetical protein